MRTRRLALSPDGETFAFVTRVTVYDPNGNVLTSFAPRGTGTRMQIEQILDRP